MSTRAFTLVETLVAIAIITIAVIGPFTTIENDLVASYTSRDELIGNSLAQEGIEYVHFVRDSSYLTSRLYGSTQTFVSIINSACISGNCTIDPTASVARAIAPCNSVCGPLYINANGIYTQVISNNTQSRFTRSFQFCYVNGAICNATLSNEIRATVTVTWSTEEKPYTTTVTDYLQNWLI